MAKFSRYIAVEQRGRRALVAQSVARPDRYYWYGGVSYTPWQDDFVVLKEYKLPGGYTSDDEDAIEVEFLREFCAPMPQIVDFASTDGNGWLAPTGEFYGCGSWQHDSMANILLAITAGKVGARASDELEKRGWLRIGDGVVISRDVIPTQSQIDTLFDITRLDSINDSLAHKAERLLEWATMKASVRA